jgi:hypothetical protein
MDTDNFRNTIEATTRNALVRFVTHFGRQPNDEEAQMLANAICAYFGIVAPTQRTN